MEEVLSVLNNVFMLMFVVPSMLAMGFGLTVGQILEPLKNWKVVVFALVASFVIVPLAGYLITLLIPMQQDYQIGLILVATAAGAPMLPKMAQLAKGNLALGVGLMTLLMVGTVIYMPIMLPILLPGVSVNPADIAVSLVVLMLIPLGIALFVRARWHEVAGYFRPKMAQLSNVGLIGLIITMLLLDWRNVLQTIGTGALASIILLILVGVVAGYFLGGAAPGGKSVFALGTAQRNLAAANVVALGNFAAQPNVLVTVIVAGVLMMVILFPLAGEFGKRAPAPKLATVAATSAPVKSGGGSGKKK